MTPHGEHDASAGHGPAGPGAATPRAATPPTPLLAASPPPHVDGAPGASDDRARSASDDQARSASEGPVSGTSVNLLKEVFERLARLQDELAARDQRVARAEADLRAAQAHLQAERADWARQREDLQRQYLERLQDQQKYQEVTSVETREQGQRLEALTHRCQELTARLAETTQARAQLAAALADARQQSPDEPRAKEPRASARAVSLTLENLSFSDHPAPTAGAVPRHGLRVVCVAVLLLVSAGLAAAVFVRQPPVRRVSGLLLVPADAAADVTTVAERLACELQPLPGRFGVRAGLAPGTLHLDLETADAPVGRRALAQIGQQVLAGLQGIAATAPAQARERLVAELRDLDAQRAGAATRPSGAALAQGDSALQGWRRLRGEREQVAGELQSLSQTLSTTAPAEAGLALDSRDLATTEAADPRLQADATALAQRQEQLAGMLRGVLQTGEPHFRKLQEALAAADQLLAEHAQPQLGEDVSRSIAVLRKVVAGWSGSCTNLAEAWREQRAAIAAAPGEALAAQAVLEPRARAFLDESAAGLEQLRQALDGIAQGGDQPTKRLVLRNQLAGGLQPAIEARELVASAARSVSLTENLELAAMRQRVAGLQGQVRERRAQMADGLRRGALAKRQVEHQAELNRAAADRERLSRRAAELDRQILEQADQAVGQLAALQGERGELARGLELHRRRAELLATLRQQELSAARAREAEGGSLLRYVALPEAPRLMPRREHLLRSAAAGAAPLLAGGVAWVIIAVVGSWRRSSRSVEECAKALQTAAREQ